MKSIPNRPKVYDRDAAHHRRRSTIVESGGNDV
jgi:hypothetical protein